MDKYNIGKVKVSITDKERTIKNIKELINDKINGYICVGNVRTTVLSQKDLNYCNVVNSALMNLPDGMPLQWAGRCAGYKQTKRTTGPDIMKELVDENNKLKHFFLGDTEETLKKLKDSILINNPKAIISGIHSPIFKNKFDNSDYKFFKEMIIKCNPDIIWVGLGAPKQDIFASEFIKYIDSGLIIGVGAAFRSYIGEYKRASSFVQKIGLEGLFWRFKLRPWFEIKWYAYHVPYYSYLLMKVLWKRIIK